MEKGEFGGTDDVLAGGECSMFSLLCGRLSIFLLRIPEVLLNEL